MRYHYLLQSKGVIIALLSVIALLGLSFVYFSYQERQNVLDASNQNSGDDDLNYSYTYIDRRLSVPFSLVFGDMKYDEWKEENGHLVIETISIPKEDLPEPSWRRLTSSEDYNYDTETILMSYESGIESVKSDDFGFYIVNSKVENPKGIVIAIHGHEEPYRGHLPDKMLDPEHWAMKFASSGYTVLIPSHLFYDQGKDLYRHFAYHFVWVRYMSDVLDVYDQITDNSVPIYAAGVSSGCTTAQILTVLHSEVVAFSGGGCTLPINWLREYYRVPNHPNQWDYPSFEDELPILAMGASKRFQFQIGREDDLYPDGKKWVRKRDGKVITARDISVSDLSGVYLSVSRIFEKASLGGELLVVDTDLGHTLDPVKSARFFEGKGKNQPQSR